MKKYIRISSLIITTALVSSMTFSTVFAFDNEPIDTPVSEHTEETTGESGGFDENDLFKGSSNLDMQIFDPSELKSSDSSADIAEDTHNITDTALTVENVPTKKSVLRSVSNNSPNTATYLSSSMLNKNNIATADGNDAWYYFDITNANTKVSTHLGAVTGSDYDIQLYNLDIDTMTLNLVDESALGASQASGEENLSIIAEPGYYYFRIAPYSHNSAATQFTYSVYTSTATRDQYEPNDSPYFATPITNSVDTRISSDSIADEDWFRFEVTENVNRHVISLTNVIPNSYKVVIYNSTATKPITIDVVKAEYSGDYVLDPLAFSPGVYYIKVKPTNFTQYGARDFSFRINASQTGITNYAEKEFIQLGTTVQSYSSPVLKSGTTYVAKITYTQGRKSMLTGEAYYGSMKNHTYTGTKERCQSWIDDTIANLGYQKFGTNPVIKISENW